MECPVCKIEFDEKTGRRPKKFCSDPCKVKFWNSQKKVVVKDYTKQSTGTTQNLNEKKETNFTIDTNKPDMVRKSPEGYVEGQDYTYSLSEDQVKKQIEAIRAEKIPDHRNTPMGKRSWQIEQQKRIGELEKQLK